MPVTPKLMPVTPKLTSDWLSAPQSSFSKQKEMQEGNNSRNAEKEMNFSYTSITLGLDSCFEAQANGCTWTKLGTQTALVACACVQREKEGKGAVGM